MTGSAVPGSALRAASSSCVRFAGKSLADLLCDVASWLLEEVGPDVGAAIVVRDRDGSLVWGHAGRPMLEVMSDQNLARDRMVQAALDEARPTRAATTVGLPLEVNGRVVGALLITATGGALDDTFYSRVVQLAGGCAVATDNVLAFSLATVRARNLEIAMASRAVIEQAKGILMERRHCDADSAFRALREMSQRGDAKLAAIAARIVSEAQIVARAGA